MTDVGTVIDLAGRQVVFGKLNATAPLLMINGHIAIDVMQFKVFEHVHLWHSFSKELQVKGMTTEYAPLLPDQALDDDVCDALVTAHAGGPSFSSAMASELAPLGQADDGVGTPRPEIPADAPGYLIDSLNGVSKEKGKGQGGPGGSCNNTTGRTSLRSSPHQAVRKPPRLLRPVHGVQEEMEVEPRSPRLGVLRHSIGFLTVATAFLQHCCGRILGDQPTPGAAGLSPRSFAFELPSDAGDSSFGSRYAQEAAAYQAQSGISANGRLLAATATASEPGGVRPSGGRDRCLEPSQLSHDNHQGSTLPAGLGSRDGPRIRVGRMKRLANTMNTSAQVLTVEHQIYADLPPAKDVPKFDIMELFAGEAEITQLAHRYGLRACQPFDILYGLDLKKPEIKRTWREAQDKFNPLLLVVETECTHWNIMNENLNYTSRGREETLDQLRRDDRPLDRLGVESCLKQIADGNYFLFENPRASRIWDLPEVRELSMRDDVYMVRDDCVDRAHYVSLVLSELLTGTAFHLDPEKWKLRQLQVTDCKSLFDAVSAENPRTTEKRTYVDIRSIQEFIDSSTIFWCPTTLMWADGLTKCTKQLRDDMTAWLKRPYIQLKAMASGSMKERIPSDKIQHSVAPCPS